MLIELTESESVIEQALDFLPQSEKIWKKGIEIVGESFFAKSAHNFPSLWKELCFRSSTYCQAKSFLQIGEQENYQDYLVVCAQIEEKFDHIQECRIKCQDIISTFVKETEIIEIIAVCEENTFVLTSQILISMMPYTENFSQIAVEFEKKKLLESAQKFYETIGRKTDNWKILLEFSKRNEKYDSLKWNFADLDDTIKIECIDIFDLDFIERYFYSSKVSSKFAYILISKLISTNHYDSAKKIARESIEKFHDPKIYCIFLDLIKDSNDFEQYLNIGIKKFPEELEIWILFIQHSESKLDNLK
jgi:hypothetical protein